MFFPLKDDNPTNSTPVLTIGLIALCSLVFMYEILVGMQEVIVQFGLIPAVLLGTVYMPPEFNAAPPTATLFTSMFLHGGWMHLIGNMLFLWVFGNNIEDVLGKFRFILFYTLCGLGAAGLQILINPDSQIPMVGASGAISGILGAYIILYPRVKVLTLIFFGIITMVRIPAVWLLGVWIGYQILFAFLDAGNTGGGTAWFAHIGGFVFGVGLIFVLKPGRRPDFALPWARKQRMKKFQNPPRYDDDDDNVHRGPWG